MARALRIQYPGAHYHATRRGNERKAVFEDATEQWNALLGYEWSSLPGHLALGKRKNFIKYETVLGYMGKDDRKGRLAYRKFIKWGMDKDVVNPLQGIGDCWGRGFCSMGQGGIPVLPVDEDGF
jgi:hypothetical protein